MQTDRHHAAGMGFVCWRMKRSEWLVVTLRLCWCRSSGCMEQDVTYLGICFSWAHHTENRTSYDRLSSSPSVPGSRMNCVFRPSVGVPHVATHAVGTVGTAVTTSVGTVSSAVAASTVGTVATGFAATASAMPRCTSPWPKLPARERSLPSSVPATTQRTVSRQST